MNAQFFEEPLLEQVKGSPAVVNVGAVGTRIGIDLLTRWLRKLAGRIPAHNPDALHTSAWPGFQSTFGARLETERSEEHTSELQSHLNLVCRLLLEKKNTILLYFPTR